MGIISDSEFLKQVEAGNISITPFDEKRLGTNSYDLHLSKHLKVYENTVKVIDGRLYPHHSYHFALDSKKENKVIDIEIPEEGYILYPGIMYLGSTIEHTETGKLHVPFIDGKSSTGRLGIRVHATAGRGDAGFRGHWTLEIDVVAPVRVYPNQRIAQIYYFPLVGDARKYYDEKTDAKYSNQGIKPVASKGHLNFKEEPSAKPNSEFDIHEIPNC